MASLAVKQGREGTPSWLAPTESSCPLLPDPDPVTIISCTSISHGYGVSLTWTCPRGGYEAFELQVGWQQVSRDNTSCGRGVSVSDLQPAQSYAATVRTIWDGLRAPAASVTCHTESAGEHSPRDTQSLQAPSGPVRRESDLPRGSFLFAPLCFVFGFL